MEAAEQNFKSTAQMMTTTGEYLLALLQALVDYLEVEAKFAPQKEFAKWIKNGGQCSFYDIQGKCKQDVLAELRSKQIPYIELANDPNKILIKSPDVDKIQAINRAVLIAHVNYFQEVDRTEMEDAIAKYDGKNINKEILTIHDLSKHEVEVIKRKCNRITKGFMVGTELEKPSDNPNEARYSISIMGDRTFFADEEKKYDFCRAYLAGMYSLYGANKKNKADQLDFDENLEKKLMSLRGKEGTTYVYSTTETGNKHYLQIDKMGFSEYVSCVDPDGKLVVQRTADIRADDINYREKLKIALDGLNDKRETNSLDDLQLHLSTDEKTATSDRPESPFVIRKCSMAEHEIVDKIDALVKERLRPKYYHDTTPEQIFEMYIKEVKEVINDVHTDEITSDYDPSRINEIKEIFNKYEISTDFKNKYVELKDSIASPKNVECHRAMLEKDRVLEKKKQAKEHKSVDRENERERIRERE